MKEKQTNKQTQHSHLLCLYSVSMNPTYIFLILCVNKHHFLHFQYETYLLTAVPVSRITSVSVILSHFAYKHILMWTRTRILLHLSFQTSPHIFFWSVLVLLYLVFLVVSLFSHRKLRPPLNFLTWTWMVSRLLSPECWCNLLCSVINTWRTWSEK